MSGFENKQGDSGSKARIVSYVYWGIFAAIVGLFSAASFHEIANYWQPGHIGYNGASYFRAALNSLRFGIVGQVKYYTGIAPPEAHQIFTHHPMAIHFHLVPLIGWLGADEWVGRLVPALYSIGSLLLLFYLVQTYYDEATALISAGIFALLPINLIFANMIDHEQGAIFWCLAHILVYFRWWNTRKSFYFWASMGTITMAVQFEWVGYYLALFTVIHAFVSHLLQSDSIFRWAKAYTFTIVYSVVVLGNAAAFFGYIVYVKGGIGEMLSSFNQRSSTPTDFYSKQWERLFDLYGTIPLVLLSLWVLYFVYRLAKSNIRLRDFLPLSFIGIQLIHSLVFKQAGHIHSYWVYYLGIGIGVGGAELIWRVCSSMTASLMDKNSSYVSGLVALTILAIPTWMQASKTSDEFEKFRQKGGSKYVSDYDDLFIEIKFSEAIRSKYDRESRRFLLHESVPDDYEWLHYLDVPQHQASTLQQPRSGDKNQKPEVLLVDLAKIGQRRVLHQLASDFGATLYNGRFLAVDGADKNGSFVAYNWVEDESPWWWMWLVNPRHGPGHWKKVSDPGEWLKRLVPNKVESSFVVGGEGGETLIWDCYGNELLKGFKVKLADANWGGIAGAKPICSADSKRETNFPSMPFFGEEPQNSGQPLMCPPGYFVSGLYGKDGKFVDSMGLYCRKLSADSKPTSDKKIDKVGGDGGSSYSHQCPKGTIATGFKGKVGLLTDGVGIRCDRMVNRDEAN